MNNIASRTWAIIILSLSLQMAWAKEPVNLTSVKKNLIEYHNTGQYEKDIDQVIKQALQYLKVSLAQNKWRGKKLAIVLDIDETALSNFPDMKKLNFGGRLKDIQTLEKRGRDPAIFPTLKLYNFARKNGVAIFFISGRPDSELQPTIRNLRKTGFTTWTGIMLRSKKFENVKSASIFKTAMRKQVIKRGYTILLNIGDQKSDLMGGYALKTYKLPNPYYFIA